MEPDAADRADGMAGTVVFNWVGAGGLGTWTMRSPLQRNIGLSLPATARVRKRAFRRIPASLKMARGEKTKYRLFKNSCFLRGPWV